MGDDFELVGSIHDVETITVNLSIRENKRLKAQFGGKRWRKLKGVALVRFPNGGGNTLERSTWCRSAKNECQKTVGLKLTRKPKSGIHFAICLAAGAEEDLQVGKVYQVLPDPKAAEVGCMRVIDDSGEDYLYAASDLCRWRSRTNSADGC
jgi:hypothetical protein